MRIPTLILTFIFPALAAAAPPTRGFISKAPAAKWEQALVSGNGTHGAMVFGTPDNETVILNHGLLYLPLHGPLPTPETAAILPQIRSLMADGKFQAAADEVVKLANANGYQGKHWTDPFMHARQFPTRLDRTAARPARRLARGPRPTAETLRTAETAVLFSANSAVLCVSAVKFPRPPENPRPGARCKNPPCQTRGYARFFWTWPPNSYTFAAHPRRAPAPRTRIRQPQPIRSNECPLLVWNALVPAFVAASLGLAQAADPVVSNLTAAQRPGTRLVDISYHVTADTPTVTVSLEVSADGGTTWTVPVTAVSGDIGAGIAVGAGKTIVWDAGVDWNNQYSAQSRYRVTVDDGVPRDVFVLIPAGSFTMGRTSGDTDHDAPPVTVNVSAFYISKHEVSKALWDEVRAWGLTNGYTDLPAGGGKAANHPVQSINWYAMVKWCNARSQKESLTPCYTVSGATYKTGTSSTVACNWGANGYRLPTEAEWEKAARGGVSGKRFSWGTDTISHNQANFRNSGGESYASGTTGYHPTYNDGTTPYTSPVGSFGANAYGLHDMAGNTWEWCWNWYSTSTYSGGATDPRGPTSGSYRVIRGGSWVEDAHDARCAYRAFNGPPTSDWSFIGFRLARGQP